MKTIEVLAGEDIRSAAERLVGAALEGEPASCGFNGITLTAEEGTTVDEIVDFYVEESARRARAYRESPEGRKAERQRRIEVENLQAKADKLMERLPTIFQGSSVLGILDNILGWLSDIEDARDRVGVKVDTALLISTFTAHGYVPGANCHEQFNESDPDNFARQIIGQAIKEPYVPLIASFAEKWRKKFGTATHSASRAT